MIKTEKQGFIQLLKIATPFIVITTVYTFFVIGLEEYFGDHIYKISGQIGSVFGLAMAFFLGFRMNSAYDRWWEARKIFGFGLNLKFVLYHRGKCKTESFGYFNPQQT